MWRFRNDRGAKPSSELTDQNSTTGSHNIRPDKNMKRIGKRQLTAALAALFTALASVAPVRATPVFTDGFGISISEDISNMGGLSQSLQNAMKLVAQDRPMVTINNTSTVSSITQIYLTMGNSTFDFGSLMLSPSSSQATADTFYPGDAPGLHAGSSFVSMTFSGFVPQQTYDFRMNIDRVSDGGMSLTNYRQALASGSDPSQWAVINVAFSDGVSLHERITPADISGAPQDPTYSYFYCLHNVPPTGAISLQAQEPASNPPPIPEPATWLLAATGAIGLSILARRQVTRAAS
jgi:hypothetical protein